MLDESVQVGKVIIYEGYLTKLIQQDLHLSVPYYTSVTKALINMGCIRQLRRGGGSSPSQWEMIYEPTEEAYLKAMPSKQPKQTRDSQNEEQIATIVRRLVALEDQVNEITTSLIKLLGTEGA
jgi:hypothetical protein